MIYDIVIIVCMIIMLIANIAISAKYKELRKAFDALDLMADTYRERVDTLKERDRFLCELPAERAVIRPSDTSFHVCLIKGAVPILVKNFAFDPADDQDREYASLCAEELRAVINEEV